MRVLLTGANGFVGSHTLEALLDVGHELRILIRHTSDTTFIDPLLPSLDVRYGELREPGSLRAAAEGVEAVVHCAGLTAAVGRDDFYSANAEGTRNLVDACNAAAPGARRFLFVSSQAVSGPGTPDRPAREDAPARPVSHYGRSKMLGEWFVRRRCRVPWTILRPAAVYGPRDGDFYLMFRSVQSGLLPLIDGGRQPLNVVYVEDVARAVVTALGCPDACRRTFHVAHPRIITQEELAGAAARAAGAQPARVFVPHLLLYPVCLLNDAIACLTGRASILGLERIPEYTAPGWVCSTERAEEELGFVARVGLQEGTRRTHAWYVDSDWLPATS
ncbi:MAG: NAD-dependent epimerase/dehydratase family protein [Candidatus Brocadiia bacterium]